MPDLFHGITPARTGLWPAAGAGSDGDLCHAVERTLRRARIATIHRMYRAGTGREFAVGPFQVQECPGTDSVDYRFTRRTDDGEVVVGHYSVDRADYEATIGNLAPQLWDGHIVTLAFQGSRGGLWLMGNWTGSGFVITPLRYTGNRLDVSWRDEGFVVTTAGDSQRRILPGR